MDIKSILNLEVEELTIDEIDDSEELDNLLGGCGINNGTGTCGDHGGDSGNSGGQEEISKME